MKSHLSLSKSDRAARYEAALKLISASHPLGTAAINTELERRTRHYRRRSDGALLLTLDQVVNAILDQDLMIPVEDENVVWLPVLSEVEGPAVEMAAA